MRKKRGKERMLRPRSTRAPGKILLPHRTIEPLTGAPQPDTARWHLATRVGFRFAFVFFPLYNMWTALHFVPLPFLTRGYSAFWNRLTEWAAANVLHVELTYSPLNTTIGSKDTLASYVQLLCYLLATALVTLVWSVVDRRRPNYQRLNVWFRLYLRMVLAAILIPYGAAKLFAAQFPAPSLSTLLESAGDSSPMHMLWTFMGASPLYSFFAGAVEVLGGVLLLVPRFTLLGAIVSAAAMGNVLMLNLGYDVPVKIFTINLVLMSLFLLLPDVKRLADVFLLDREASPAVERPLFRRRLLNQVAIALQLLFGLGLLTADLDHRHRDARAIVQNRISAPLHGVWTVEEFTVDGQERPPLATDNFRWHRMIIDGPGAVVVQPMQRSLRYFLLRLDPALGTFRMTKPGELWEADFTYDRVSPEELRMQGEMDGHQVKMTMRRSDESQFLLMNRGFHWINEVPINR